MSYIRRKADKTTISRSKVDKTTMADNASYRLFVNYVKVGFWFREGRFPLRKISIGSDRIGSERN